MDQPKTRGRPSIDSITQPQQRVWRAIETFLRDRGYPPTIQELAGSLRIASATVHAHVKQLERKGYLKREGRKARGLVLARSSEQPLLGLVEIPLVGVVAAGQPLFAPENVLGHILVEGRPGLARCFALRVTGDSMQDADIHDGDVLVVQQQQLAEHNDIVVALVDGEATVKRLFWREQRIELHPENARYQPLRIGPDTDLRIAGKVIAVHRPTPPSS